MQTTIKANLATIFTAIGLLAGGAQGAITIIVQDSGSNVLVTYSGSVNLAGLTYAGSGSGTAAMGSSSGVAFVAVAGAGSVLADIYTGLTGFPTLSLATSIPSASTNIGDAGFGIQTLTSGPTGRVLVPQGYTSGSPLSAIQTFSGQSIAGMGLQYGSYEWTWSSDKAIVNIVPEPSSILLVGLGAVGFARRRCRNN